MEPLEVLLAQTDSTSAAGWWLWKSNFDAEIQPLHLVITGEMATLVMDGGFGLYSQWFPGGTRMMWLICFYVTLI
jgi:hypothetical protein